MASTRALACHKGKTPIDVFSGGAELRFGDVPAMNDECLVRAASLVAAPYRTSGNARRMRCAIAFLLLLIQFFVQIIPLAIAEDGLTVLTNSGAVLQPDVPMHSSGATLSSESGSGSSMSSSSSGVLLSASSSVSSLSPSSPVRIVLTEVMWMGSNVSTADEWVEIAVFGSGSSTVPRNLSGWTLLSVKAGVETVLARLPFQEVSSGTVLVVANNHATTSRLLNEPNIVTTGMSLPNTQLLLRLRDASGLLVDEVDDGIGAPFAGANPSGGGSKASMERIDAWSAGNSSTNWKAASLTIGFDDGPLIFGTPGFVGPVLVSVSPVSSSSSASSSFSSSSGVVLSSTASSSVSSFESSSSGVLLSASASFSSQTPLTTTTVLAPLIHLTEILANPGGLDTDEWLEIGSVDSSPADLSDMALRTGTTRFALSGQLQPGEHRRYGKIVTGLPLPNVGGTVELLWRDRVIDTWTYTETAEGVSVARYPDGSSGPLCVPSPDAPNTPTPVDPIIGVQSSTTGGGKATLNLEARVEIGSLVGATCSWNYPDGYASDSCNPPSHSMTGPIVGDVFLVVHDYCGNTVTRSLHVDIAGANVPLKEREPFVCMPTAFTGVLLSEVLPNPTGDDTDGEWIELLNPSGDEKALCGWSLDDEEHGSDPFALDRFRLPPGERLVFTRKQTGIALNNDRDAVRLLAPLKYGGGSGAYEIVRYQSAPEGQSYARRDDGVWLWSDTPTPEAANTFAVLSWPMQVLAKIVQALPNPKGKDADGGEWVELHNETPFPLPLTGWILQTKAKNFTFESLVLGPSERKRIELDPSALTLPNTDGVLRLLDSVGTPVSELAWGKTHDGWAVKMPTSVRTLEGLTFLAAETCFEWRAKDAKDELITIHLSGLRTEQYLKCIDLVLTLMEGKKFDQEIYSDSGSLVFLNGVNMGSLLVKSGVAVVDDDVPESLRATYMADETEAREERRGLWASEEYAALLDSSRQLESQRHVLANEGLKIAVQPASGIVSSGATVTLTTNIPASIEIATESGHFVAYTGPFTVDHDLMLKVRATSDVQTASGSPVVAYSEYAYALLKDHYPVLRISELYPSPQAGEEEWLELWNPTEESVSLTGWMIDDVSNGGSKPTMFAAGTIISPHERMRVGDLSIAWNNSGDTARLITPNGHISDTFEYGSIKKGQAIAALFADDGRHAGTCITIEPTPGAENRCIDPPVKMIKKKATKAPKVRKAKVKYRNVLSDVLQEGEVRSIFEQLKGVGGVPLTGIHGTSIFWLTVGLGVIISFIVISSIGYRKR